MRIFVIYPRSPKTYFIGTVATVVDTAVLAAIGVGGKHFVALAIASAMHVSHNGNGYGNN